MVLVVDLYTVTLVAGLGLVGCVAAEICLETWRFQPIATVEPKLAGGK